MAMKRFVVLLLAFVAAGSALLATGCRKPEPPQAPGGGGMPPAAVKVAAAVAGDVPLYRDEIGRCVARESVTLKPQVSGRVVQIHFADGADVKSGDLLFTIDPRPFQAQVAAAEANLAQSVAERNLAKVELTRALGLLEKKAVAQQEVDTARNAVEVAEARNRQYQAALDIARLNLEYCTLKSPIEGRVGHRLVDVGNTVTANDTALLVIQRMDPIYADFNVTEGELAVVRKKMAEKALKAEIRIPDDPGEPRVGELTFVDNAINRETGTVLLRATVQNPDRRLWPGRFVNVRLVLDTLKDAVLIPAEAMQISAQGPYVYVVTDDLKAEMRVVKLGQRQDNKIVVEQGVKAGERVVTVVNMMIMPGGSVRIEEPGKTQAGK
jgi:membrane fusion protein, multidrug efflux system